MRVSLDRALAADVLRRLPPEPRRRIKNALRDLLPDPFPSNPNVAVRQLDIAPDREAVYRVRVGTWRSVYVVRGATIQVIRILRRDESYAGLE